MVDEKTPLKWGKILVCGLLSVPVGAVLTFLFANAVLALFWGGRHPFDTPTDTIMILSFLAMPFVAAVVAALACAAWVRTRRLAHALRALAIPLAMAGLIVLTSPRFGISRWLE